jgi:lipid II:glycine glycyltransferase (peptidoglycan interpeptide bridge formation enzyme)
LEQEQHQTLKANKILEVEVAKKQETVMNLAEQVKKLNAELERAYQDIKHQNGLQEQKNNEIEELQSQLVTGPKAPSFAEESAIAKMQKDLDILEEQLAMVCI